MKLSDLKDTLMIAALGFGGYLVYKALKGGSTLTTKVGESIGETLFDFFNPNTTGDMIYYVVTFPNGERHSIAGSLVASNGAFTYQGTSYLMKLNASNQHVAVLA